MQSAATTYRNIISRQTTISLFSRQSSFKQNDDTVPISKKSSEFSLDIANENNKESFAELQLINSICKSFRLFTYTQKKQFLLRFLNSCKKQTINDINLFLEPLEHRDFCINAEKEYPKWIELDEKKRIIFSGYLESKTKKQTKPSSRKPTGSRASFGSTTGYRKTPQPQRTLRTPLHAMRATRLTMATPSFSLKRSNSLKIPSATSITSKKPPSAVRKSLTHVEINPNLLIETPDKHSIDHFIRDKSARIIRKPWSMNEDVFKNHNTVNTDSVIEKLKCIFREHYKVKLEEKKSKRKIKNQRASDFLNKLQKEVNKIPNRKQSITSSVKKDNIENEAGDIEPSIYLKKLQNNFYERKLWDSLELNDKNYLFNLYTDTSREYTSEFSIVKRYDWTKSTFGKSLSKYKVIPSIQSLTNTINNNTDEDSLLNENNNANKDDFQILDVEPYTKSREQARQEFLEISEKFIQETKYWSSTRKLTLLAALLKYCHNIILLFVRDVVKERVDKSVKNINCLPDNVLLRIFQLLDTNSLENAAQVCQRWNYLANIDELWIYKCKRIGQREKLYQVETVIHDELQDDEDIDWKMAYYELEEFVNKLKTDYYKKMISDFEFGLFEKGSLNTIDKLTDDKKRKSALTPIMSETNSRRNSTTIDQSKKTSIIMQKSRLQTYVNFYTEEPEKKPKKKKSILKKQTSRSSTSMLQPSIEESAITTNTGVSFDSKLFLNESITVQESQIFDDNNKLKLTQSLDPKLTDLNKKPDSNAIVAPDIDENIEESKMELKQAKDLLGKIQPNYRLRWKFENEDDDDIKSTEKILFNLKPINQVRNLRNHFESVTCMDYDKRRLITGGMDRLIIVFDIRNGQLIRRLKGHKGGIRCLQFLANRLCSGSWDMTLRIWNLITFELVCTLYDNSGAVSCLDFDFKYLFTGSHDTTMQIYFFDDNYIEGFKKQKDDNEQNLKVIHLVRKIDYHKAPVTALKYDGIKTIISSNTDGSIIIIDVEGNLLKELKHEQFFDPIITLKLVGGLIICSTNNGRIVFWNRFNDECEAIIQCHEACINAIAYYDGRFYTGANDGLLKEWDLRTLTCLREIKAHNGALLDIQVTDVKIITCGADKLVRIWEMTTPIDKIPNEALDR